MQHTQEDPGQTDRWTAGQVRQGAELMHQGTAKTSQKQKTSQEPEPHQNNPQGTNATWKESDKSQQENMAAEGAWLSRNGRAADLLECVAPRAKEIGTDQAGVQEISIVREQRTIGTQTHNSGDMQRQEVNQGGMDQHEFVRSSKRPDQWRTGELMWQEQPGPTNHMSQHRYTGGQHLPRWERTERQTQGQEEGAYLAKDGAKGLQGQQGGKSARPEHRVRGRDSERSVRDTGNGYGERGNMRGRHGIRRYQTTIILNSKYQQHHLTRGNYWSKEQDSRELPPGEYRRQKMAPQENVRDRNRALDDNMPSRRRNGGMCQGQDDTENHQKPYADSGYWAQNKLTGTLNTSRKADWEHQQHTNWRKEGQSHDRGHTTRQYSNCMNVGYQNWGRHLRRQDSNGYTPVRHGQLDMMVEEQTQKQVHNEWAEIERPQDAGRSEARDQTQYADVQKGEGTQDQDSATWRPHHYLSSGHQDEIRRVRFQKIGSNERGQEQCSISVMSHEDERLQVPLHARRMPSPQEDRDQEYTRNPDQGGANRMSGGQGVRREPWQQARMTGLQNISMAPGSLLGPKRTAWLDQVTAVEGFLRRNGNLETVV